MLTLAAVLFLWWAGLLSARIRDAEGSPGWLSRVVLVSGSAFAVVMVVGFLVGGMVADIGDDTDAFTIDPNTVRLLTDATSTFVFETALPLVAPMVVAASVAFVRTGLLPRRLGQAGVALGILCLVGFLGIPMGLFLLWVGIVAVYLTKRPATAATIRSPG